MAGQKLRAPGARVVGQDSNSGCDVVCVCGWGCDVEVGVG